MTPFGVTPASVVCVVAVVAGVCALALNAASRSIKTIESFLINSPSLLKETRKVPCRCNKTSGRDKRRFGLQTNDQIIYYARLPAQVHKKALMPEPDARGRRHNRGLIRAKLSKNIH
jgi:hypothetical protein